MKQQRFHRLNVSAALSDYRNALELWFWRDDDRGARELLSDLGEGGEFVPCDDRVADPTLILPSELARSLMDELWRAGLRPRGVKDPTSEVAAVKYHLEDMRRLVFKTD